MMISIADKQFLLSSSYSFFPWLCRLLDVRAAREQMHLGGVTYPTLPLQEAVPRPQSGYGQQSAACSPSSLFPGPLPTQPHSAYFSGMTGPQHPFYNRVRKNGDPHPHNSDSYLFTIIISPVHFLYDFLFFILFCTPPPSPHFSPVALFPPSCVSPATALLPPSPLLILPLFH